jgi:hypothetical protein
MYTRDQMIREMSDSDLEEAIDAAQVNLDRLMVEKRQRTYRPPSSPWPQGRAIFGPVVPESHRPGLRLLDGGKK